MVQCYRAVDQPWTARNIYPLQKKENEDITTVILEYTGIYQNIVVIKATKITTDSKKKKKNLGMILLPIRRNSARLQAPRFTYKPPDGQKRDKRTSTLLS